MPTVIPQDHRTRVARARREHTRGRLVAGAMAVFARTGLTPNAIDLVTAEAGVARGTFYNYFQSADAILVAVAREVSDEMLAIVDPLVRREDSPAGRVATGVRLMLGLARAHPQLAAFMVRAGVAAVSAEGLAVRYVSRDLAAGRAAGEFARTPPRVAFDLVAGSVLAGFNTILSGKAPRSYDAALAGAVLQGLGVPARTAAQLARRPLPRPEIPRESLLARAGA